MVRSPGATDDVSMYSLKGCWNDRYYKFNFSSNWFYKIVKLNELICEIRF